MFVMSKVALSTLVRYTDRLLGIEGIQDWPGAVNGLQMQNRGKVARLAATVDAGPGPIAKAISLGADLLIVHHGLFWRSSHPWTGQHYELMRQLLDHDLAIYSSHLPLDVHPRLGNNAGLAAALGLKPTKPFFLVKDQHLGLLANQPVSRESLCKRLTRVLGATPTVIPAGPAKCRRIGIVTGGAGAELDQAADEGVDTFITGEGPHWTYTLAEQRKINVFYGGHYATETFGVKALTQHLSKRFDLPWVFVDHPTNL